MAALAKNWEQVIIDVEVEGKIYKKGEEKKCAVFFGLAYDLRYFFDDFFFYFASPQHFGHVNDEKQHVR